MRTPAQKVPTVPAAPSRMATPATSSNSRGTFIQQMMVPLDFSPLSDRALDYALALAARAGAALQLIHIVEPLPFLSSMKDLPIVMSDSESAEHWEKVLAQMAKGLAPEGVSVSSAVRTGRPAAEIVKFAEEKGVDLLVLSTHGRTGLQHVLMGSTAEKIVRHSPCPLLVLPRREAEGASSGKATLPRYDRIVVPIDFSPSSEEALQYAGRFAEEFGGELILVHCIYYTPSVVGPEYGTFDAAVVTESSSKAAAAELAQLIRRSVPAGLVARGEVCFGPPLGEVPKFAERVDADLIICSTHGRTGLPHVLLGSTAEGLVRHSGRPTLVVPQRARKSPAEA